MEASQTVQGTSIADYESNRENYTIIFTNSIASCMDNVTIDQIFNLVVTSGARRRFLRSSVLDYTTATTKFGLSYSSATGPSRVLQSSNSIDLAYQVQVNNPSITYESLSTQLAASVSAGVFDRSLKVFATEYNAPGLANASSTHVTTIEIEIPMAPTGDSKKDYLNGGIIAGIVLVSLLACCICCAAVFKDSLEAYFYPHDKELEIEPEDASRTSSSSVKHYLNNPINPHAISGIKLETDQRPSSSFETIEMSMLEPNSNSRPVRENIPRKSSVNRSSEADGAVNAPRKSMLDRLSIWTGAVDKGDNSERRPSRRPIAGTRQSVSPGGERKSSLLGVSSSSSRGSVAVTESDQRPESPKADRAKSMTSRRGSNMFVAANPLNEGGGSRPSFEQRPSSASRPSVGSSSNASSSTPDFVRERMSRSAISPGLKQRQESFFKGAVSAGATEEPAAGEGGNSSSRQSVADGSRRKSSRSPTTVAPKGSKMYPADSEDEPVEAYPQQRMSLFRRLSNFGNGTPEPSTRSTSTLSAELSSSIGKRPSSRTSSPATPDSVKKLSVTDSRRRTTSKSDIDGKNSSSSSDDPDERL
jgi:hypothetical protein